MIAPQDGNGDPPSIWLPPRLMCDRLGNRLHWGGRVPVICSANSKPVRIGCLLACWAASMQVLDATAVHTSAWRVTHKCNCKASICVACSTQTPIEACNSHGTAAHCATAAAALTLLFLARMLCRALAPDHSAGRVPGQCRHMFSKLPGMMLFDQKNHTQKHRLVCADCLHAACIGMFLHPKHAADISFPSNPR